MNIPKEIETQAKFKTGDTTARAPDSTQSILQKPNVNNNPLRRALAGRKVVAGPVQII